MLLFLTSGLARDRSPESGVQVKCSLVYPKSLVNLIVLSVKPTIFPKIRSTWTYPMALTGNHSLLTIMLSSLGTGIHLMTSSTSQKVKRYGVAVSVLLFSILISGRVLGW